MPGPIRGGPTLPPLVDPSVDTPPTDTPEARAPSRPEPPIIRDELVESDARPREVTSRTAPTLEMPSDAKVELRPKDKPSGMPGPPPAGTLDDDVTLLSGLHSAVEVTNAETFGNLFDSKWEITHPPELVGLPARGSDEDYEGSPIRGEPIQIVVKLKEPAPGRAFRIRVAGPELSRKDAVQMQAKNVAKIMDRLGTAGLGRFGKVTLSREGGVNVDKPSFIKGSDLHSAFGTTSGAKLELNTKEETLLHGVDGKVDSSQKNFFQLRDFFGKLNEDGSLGANSSTNEAQAILKCAQKACGATGSSGGSSVEIRPKDSQPEVDTDIHTGDDPSVEPTTDDSQAKLKADIAARLEALAPYPEIETPYREAFETLADAIGRDDARLADLKETLDDIDSHLVALREQISELDLEFAEVLKASEEGSLSPDELAAKLETHELNRVAYSTSIEGFNEGAHAFATVLEQTLADVAAQDGAKAAAEAEAKALDDAKVALATRLSTLPELMSATDSFLEAYRALEATGDTSLIEKKGFGEKVAALVDERDAITERGAPIANSRERLLEKTESATDASMMGKLAEKAEGLTGQIETQNGHMADFNQRADALAGEIRRAAEVALASAQAAKDRAELREAKGTMLEGLHGALSPMPDTGYGALLAELEAMGASDIIRSKEFDERAAALDTRRDKLEESSALVGAEREALTGLIEDAADVGVLSKLEEKVEVAQQKVGPHNEGVSQFADDAAKLSVQLQAALVTAKAIADASAQLEALNEAKGDVSERLGALPELMTPTESFAEAFRALEATGESSIIAKKGFADQVAALAGERDGLIDGAGPIESRRTKLAGDIDKASDTSMVATLSEKAEGMAKQVDGHNGKVSDFNQRADALAGELQQAAQVALASAQAAKERAELREAKGTMLEGLHGALSPIADADYRAVMAELQAMGGDDIISKKGLDERVDALDARRDKLEENAALVSGEREALAGLIEDAANVGVLSKIEEKVEVAQQKVGPHNDAVTRYGEDAAILTRELQAAIVSAKAIADATARLEALNAAKAGLTERLGALPELPYGTDVHETAVDGFTEAFGTDEAEARGFTAQVAELAKEKFELSLEAEKIQTEAENLGVGISRSGSLEDLGPHQSGLSELEERSQALLDKVSDFDTRAATLADAVAGAETDILANQTEAREVADLRAALGARLGELEEPAEVDGGFEDAFAELIALTGSGPQVASGLADRVTALAEDCADARAAADGLVRDREGLTTEVGSAGSRPEVEELGQRLDDLTSGLDAHATQVSSLGEQGAALTSDIREAIAAHHAAVEQAQALEALRGELTEAMAGLNPDTVALSDEAMGLYEHFVEVAGEASALRSGFKAQAEALEAERETLGAERAALGDAISTLRSAVGNAADSADLDGLKGEIASLTEKIATHDEASSAYNTKASDLTYELDRALRGILDAPTIDLGQFLLNPHNPSAQASYTEFITDVSKLSEQMQSYFETTDDPALREHHLHDGLDRLLERNRTRLATRHDDLSAVYELPPFRSLAGVLLNDLRTHGTRIPTELHAKGGDTKESQEAYAAKLTEKHMGRLSFLLDAEKAHPMPLPGQTGSAAGARALGQCTRLVNTEQALAGALSEISTPLSGDPSAANQALLEAVDAARNPHVAKTFGAFKGHKLTPSEDNALTQFATSGTVKGKPAGQVVVYRADAGVDGASDQIVLMEGVGKLAGHPVKFEGNPLRTELPGYSESFRLEPEVVRSMSREGKGIPFDNFLPIRSARGRTMVLVNAGKECFAYEVNRRNELSPVPLDGDPKVAVRARAFLVKQLLETGQSPADILVHIRGLNHEDPSRLEPVAGEIAALRYETTGDALTDAVVLMSLDSLQGQVGDGERNLLTEEGLERSFRDYLASDVPSELKLHPSVQDAIASELGLTHLADRCAGLSLDAKQALMGIYDDVRAPIKIPKSSNKKPLGADPDGQAELFGHVSHYLWTLSASKGEDSPRLDAARERLQTALTQAASDAPSLDDVGSQERFTRSFGAKLMCLDVAKLAPSDLKLLKEMRDPYARGLKLALLNRESVSGNDAKQLARRLRTLENSTALKTATKLEFDARHTPTKAALSLEGGRLDALAAKHGVMMKASRTVASDKRDAIDGAMADRLVEGVAAVHGDSIRAEFGAFVSQPDLKIEFDFENQADLTPQDLHKKLNGQAYRLEEALVGNQEAALAIARGIEGLERADLEDLTDMFLAGTTPDNPQLNEAIAATLLFENQLGQLRGIQEQVVGALSLDGNPAKAAVSSALGKLSGMQRGYGLRDEKNRPGVGLFERRLMAFERMFGTQLRESQYEMVKGITSGGKRFVNCGTGFGKTFSLQLVIWNQLLDNRAKTDGDARELVVIQPTDNLREKTKGDYASFGSRSEVGFTLLETPFAQWDGEWDAKDLPKRLTAYAQQLDKGRVDSDVAWLLSDADELALRGHHRALSQLPERTEAEENALMAMDAMMGLLRERSDKFIDEHDNVLSPERVGSPGKQAQRGLHEHEAVATLALSDAIAAVGSEASREDLAEAFATNLASSLPSVPDDGLAWLLTTQADVSEPVPSDAERAILDSARELMRLAPSLLSERAGEDFTLEGNQVVPLVHGSAVEDTSFGPLTSAFFALQLGGRDALESLSVPDPTMAISRQELLDCHRVTGLSATTGNPSITAALTSLDSGAMFTDVSTTRPRLVYQLAKDSTAMAVVSGSEEAYIDNLLEVIPNQVEGGATRPMIFVDGGGDLEAMDRHALVETLYEKRKDLSPNYRVSFFAEDKTQWVFTGQSMRPYEPSLDDAFQGSTDYYLPPAMSEAGTDVRQGPNHVVVSTGVSDLDNETQQIGRGRQLDKGQVLLKVFSDRVANELGVDGSTSAAALKESYLDRLTSLERDKAPQTLRSSEEALVRMAEVRIQSVKTPPLQNEVRRLLEGASSIRLTVPDGLTSIRDDMPLGLDMGRYLTEYSQQLWEDVEQDLAGQLENQYLECILDTFQPAGVTPEDFAENLDRIVSTLLEDRPALAAEPLSLPKLAAAAKRSDAFRHAVQDGAEVKFPRNMMKSIGACSKASSRQSVHTMVRAAKGPNASGADWADTRGALIQNAARMAGDGPVQPLLIQYQGVS